MHPEIRHPDRSGRHAGPPQCGAGGGTGAAGRLGRPLRRPYPDPEPFPARNRPPGAPEGLPRGRDGLQRRLDELRRPRLLPPGAPRRSRRPRLPALAQRPGPDRHQLDSPPGTGALRARRRTAPLRGHRLPRQPRPPLHHLPGRWLRPRPRRPGGAPRRSLRDRGRRDAPDLFRKPILYAYEPRFHFSPFPPDLPAFLRRRKAQRPQRARHRGHGLRPAPLGPARQPHGLL